MWRDSELDQCCSSTPGQKGAAEEKRSTSCHPETAHALVVGLCNNNNNNNLLLLLSCWRTL